jgi:hypothetical protein
MRPEVDQGAPPPPRCGVPDGEEEVGGVVGEVRGTGAELVEVEARGEAEVCCRLWPVASAVSASC